MLHRLHVAQVALCTFPVTSCQLPGCQLPIPVAVSSSPRRSQFEFRNSGCRGATRQQTAATPPCCDALLFFLSRSACNPSIDRSIAIYRLCAYQFGQHLRANETSQGKSQRADCPIVTKKKKTKKKVAEGKVPHKERDKRKAKKKARSAPIKFCI